MRPTDEQSEIREYAGELKRGESMRINAFAGAGKTSTLKLVAHRMPGRGTFLSFNKTIAQEARDKLQGTRCSASTFHGLASRALGGYIDQPVRLNARVVRASGVLNEVCFPRMFGWNEFRLASTVCKAFEAFCNSDDQEILPKHVHTALIEAVGDPEVLRSPELKDKAATAIERLTGPLVEATGQLFVHFLDAKEYPFSMWLKMLDLDEGLRQDAFGSLESRYVLVDEAQDLNPVMTSILLKSRMSLISVGDSAQAIYGWRGAIDALQMLPGKEFYLTGSFRFGENIAEKARRILAARPDGGPSKRLVGLGSGDYSDFRGPIKAALICRTNLGILDGAAQMARQNIRVVIDNIEGLVGNLECAAAMHAGKLSVPKTPDLAQFDTWDELKAEAKQGDPSLSRLVSLVENNRINDIKRLSNGQVDVEQAQVVIATAHRLKGLELPVTKLGPDWKHVEVMREQHRIASERSELQGRLAMEQFNALYVAATRAIGRSEGVDELFKPLPVRPGQSQDVIEGRRPARPQPRQEVGAPALV